MHYQKTHILKHNIQLGKKKKTFLDSPWDLSNGIWPRSCLIPTNQEHPWFDKSFLGRENCGLCIYSSWEELCRALLTVSWTVSFRGFSFSIQKVLQTIPYLARHEAGDGGALIHLLFQFLINFLLTIIMEGIASGDLEQWSIVVDPLRVYPSQGCSHVWQFQSLKNIRMQKSSPCPNEVDMFNIYQYPLRWEERFCLLSTIQRYFLDTPFHIHAALDIHSTYISNKNVYLYYLKKSKIVFWKKFEQNRGTMKSNTGKKNVNCTAILVSFNMPHQGFIKYI